MRCLRAWDLLEPLCGSASRPIQRSRSWWPAEGRLREIFRSRHTPFCARADREVRPVALAHREFASTRLGKILAIHHREFPESRKRDPWASPPGRQVSARCSPTSRRFLHPENRSMFCRCGPQKWYWAHRWAILRFCDRPQNRRPANEGVRCSLPPTDCPPDLQTAPPRSPSGNHRRRPLPSRGTVHLQAGQRRLEFPATDCRHGLRLDY